MIRRPLQRLIKVIAEFEQLDQKVGKSGLSMAAKADLSARLEEKSRTGTGRVNDALHVNLEATVVSR